MAGHGPHTIGCKSDSVLLIAVNPPSSAHSLRFSICSNAFAMHSHISATKFAFFSIDQRSCARNSLPLPVCSNFIAAKEASTVRSSVCFNFSYMSISPASSHSNFTTPSQPPYLSIVSARRLLRENLHIVSYSCPDPRYDTSAPNSADERLHDIDTRIWLVQCSFPVHGRDLFGHTDLLQEHCFARRSDCCFHWFDFSEWRTALPISCDFGL